MKLWKGKSESLRTKLRCFCLKAEIPQGEVKYPFHTCVLLFHTRARAAREITVTKVDTQLD